jgi:hypothetical protein
MTTHDSRPAIELAPTATPHPTLALILALLAVPGSTVAWDLPLGGLWLGLPLALAAIALGLMARREGSHRGRATTAVILGALCVAQMAVWSAVSLAGGDAPGARTLNLKELDRGSTFVHIRNSKASSPRANEMGDVIAFTNPIVDESGRRVGKSSVSCTTTTGARNFMRSTLTCLGTLALRDGTLMAQVSLSPAQRTVSGAITGGTGAYANARGVFESRTVRGGSVDTITLAD